VKTLEAFSQDPAFSQVQSTARHRWPEQWATIEFELRATARELGTFSAEDVLDRVGRLSVPPNLIGAVLGSWRARRLLRTVGREKSRHRAAKGRWINRFELAGDPQ
jgi:hypothetical protein